MKKILILVLLLASPLCLAKFILLSPAFKSGDSLPSKYAFCRADHKGNTAPSQNFSPPLQWVGIPEKTKSFVLLLSDPNIPQKSAVKNFNGKISRDTPREIGYHWVLINIPVTINALPDKAGTNHVGKTLYGIQGLNYYSEVGGADMGGYGGPCPPIHDVIKHHYFFRLYALDQNLDLPESGAFNGADVLKAMNGHILGVAKLTVKYTTKSDNLSPSSLN